MTFSDGLGTYLRIWTDGTWAYVSASMRLHTLLIAGLMYVLVGLFVARHRERKAARARMD